MRFLFGILLGLSIGFAGAILFAPQASPLRQTEGKRSEDPMGDAIRKFGGDSDAGERLNGTMKSLRRRVNEAMDEAKKAAEEAEKEVRSRFEEMVGEKRDKK